MIEKAFFIFLILYGLVLPISTAAVNLIVGFLLLLGLISFFKKKETVKRYLPRSICYLLLFFLWAAITDWSTRDRFFSISFSAFGKIWNFFPYLFIPLIGFKLTPEKTIRILKITTVTGIVVVILGTIQYLTGIHYFFEGWFSSKALVIQQRFCGFQSHPLHSGGFYTILFLTVLSYALFYQTKENQFNFSERVFWYGSAIILGLGVFLTGSRSYYLAVISGVILLLVLRGWKFFLIGMFALTLFLFSVTTFFPYVKQRFTTISPQKMDESGKQRIYMWKSALLMIRDHPIMGVGYKKWKENLPNYFHYFPEWHVDDAVLAHSHNSYLTITSETGLLGLAIFLLFWFRLIKEQFMILFLVERKTVSYSLIAGTIVTIFSLMVAAVFEHNLLTAVIVLSLFFLIGLSRVQTIQAIEE